MSTVNDLSKNREKYSEYVSYFETVATNLNAIGHSPTHHAFERYDLINMFGNKFDRLASPFLGLEDPTVVVRNNNNENIQWRWLGAFTVAYECHEDDETAKRAALDNALVLIRKVMAKMKSDRRKRRIFDVDFDTFQMNPIKQIFRNYYGYRVQFQFSSQIDLSFNLADWSNESDAQPLPPFATVIDNGVTLELAYGESHTCSTPTAGTVVIKDSLGNIIDSIEVPAGQSTNAEIPDATLQAIDTFGNVLAITEVTAANDDAFITIPNVTHIDSDGEPVELPAGVPFVADLCEAIPIISVSTSDATTSFGSSVIFTCVNNFEADLFTFYLPTNLGQIQEIEQAGNTLNYTCARAGTHIIKVSGINTTTGRTACGSVQITVGTLEDKYNVTASFGHAVDKIDDKVNQWTDISGNGHHAIAPSITSRCSTNKWPGSSEAVGVYSENDDRLVTDLNQNVPEVCIAGVFDFNDNTVQGSFDTLGLLSGNGNITGCRYNILTSDDSVSPRSLSLQVRTSAGAFNITGNLTNGRVVFVMRYSTGTLRTIVNGAVSTLAVTGTLVGSGTNNFVLLNANAGSWSLPFPFTVYRLCILTTAISDADQDQMYQDLLTQYPAP